VENRLKVLQLQQHKTVNYFTDEIGNYADKVDRCTQSVAKLTGIVSDIQQSLNKRQHNRRAKRHKSADLDSQVESSGGSSSSTSEKEEEEGTAQATTSKKWNWRHLPYKYIERVTERETTFLRILETKCKITDAKAKALIRARRQFSLARALIGNEEAVRIFKEDDGLSQDIQKRIRRQREDLRKATVKKTESAETNKEEGAAKDKPRGGGGKPADRACFTCGLLGHISRDCPKRVSYEQ